MQRLPSDVVAECRRLIDEAMTALQALDRELVTVQNAEQRNQLRCGDSAKLRISSLDPEDVWAEIVRVSGDGCRYTGHAIHSCRLGNDVRRSDVVSFEPDHVFDFCHHVNILEVA